MFSKKKSVRLKKQSEATILFGTIVSILIAISSFYLQSKDPTTGWIILIAIFIFVLLYFILSYPIELINKKFRKIDFIFGNVKELEKDLNNHWRIN